MLLAGARKGRVFGEEQTLHPSVSKSPVKITGSSWDKRFLMAVIPQGLEQDALPGSVLSQNSGLREEYEKRLSLSPGFQVLLLCWQVLFAGSRFICLLVLVT